MGLSDGLLNAWESERVHQNGRTRKLTLKN